MPGFLSKNDAVTFQELLLAVTHNPSQTPITGAKRGKVKVCKRRERAEEDKQEGLRSGISGSGGGGLEGSVRFQERRSKFNKGRANEVDSEKYGRRRGGGTRWTSARGEDALICSSVTHQSGLSDSEAAECFFKRGYKAQGRT